MKLKLIILTSVLLLSSGLATANITFDHSGDIVFDSNLQVNQDIQGYFNSACGSGQAVTDIYDNGTLECSTVDSGDTPTLGEVLDQNNAANQNIDLNSYNIVGLSNPSNPDEAVTLDYLQNQYEASGSQNLSQVLEEGNVANQTIEFEGFNTSVGNEAYAYLDGGTAYGYNASAGTLNGIAIGTDSRVPAGWEGTIAIGANSEAEASGIALGYISSATGERAVAIGNRAVASNDNEVSLGAFDGEQLNLNVTGNATVNENLEVKGELTGVDTGGSASGLSEVLEENNVANQSVEFEGGVAVGSGTVEAGTISEVAIGRNAEANSYNSDSGDIAIGLNSDTTSIEGEQIAIGKNSVSENAGGLAVGAGATSGSSQGLPAAALGYNASAEGDGSVALGYRASAPNDFEATLGNLNGDELDLNVTGNATIHGSGGLDMPNGVVIGDRDTEVGDSSGIAIGDNSSIGGPGFDNIALGNSARVDSATDEVVAIGKSSFVGSEARRSIVLGKSASIDSLAEDAVALGAGASSIGPRGVSIGNDASSGTDGTSLGHGADTSEASMATAIGMDSSGSAQGAVAVGANSVSDKQDTARFGSDSRPYDVDVTGDLSVDGQVDEQNVRDISYSSGHTAWSDGLTDEEVNRFGANSDEKIIVNRLDVQLKGGGSSSNFNVDVYDDGDNTVLGSADAGQSINDVGETAVDSPLAVRVTNNAGRSVEASITVSGEVVDTSEVTRGLE